jgi:hypothetical protein
MTIALTPYELPTLASDLEARGEAPEPLYSCGCGRHVPAEGAVDTTGLPGALPRWVCHVCASGPLREAHQAAFELARALAGPDWSGVRSRRDGLLARSDWRLAPDNGLSDEARAAWIVYRQALRDLTSAFPSPDLVEWPVPPSN